MEEYHDFRRRSEFGDECTENWWSGFAGFVEEDAEAVDAGEDRAALTLG